MDEGKVLLPLQIERPRQRRFPAYWSFCGVLCVASGQPPLVLPTQAEASSPLNPRSLLVRALRDRHAPVKINRQTPLHPASMRQP
jgi:hypothetical protein